MTTSTAHQTQEWTKSTESRDKIFEILNRTTSRKHRFKKIELTRRVDRDSAFNYDEMEVTAKYAGKGKPLDLKVVVRSRQKKDRRTGNVKQEAHSKIFSFEDGKLYLRVKDEDGKLDWGPVPLEKMRGVHEMGMRIFMQNVLWALYEMRPAMFHREEKTNGAKGASKSADE